MKIQDSVNALAKFLQSQVAQPTQDFLTSSPPKPFDTTIRPDTNPVVNAGKTLGNAGASFGYQGGQALAAPIYDAVKNALQLAQGKPLTTWESTYSPLTRVAYDALSSGPRHDALVNNPVKYAGALESQTRQDPRQLTSATNPGGTVEKVSQRKLLADANNQANGSLFPTAMAAPIIPPGGLPKTPADGGTIFDDPGVRDPNTPTNPPMVVTDKPTGPVALSGAIECDPETGLPYEWFDVPDSYGGTKKQAVAWRNGVPCDPVTGLPLDPSTFNAPPKAPTPWSGGPQTGGTNTNPPLVINTPLGPITLPAPGGSSGAGGGGSGPGRGGGFGN